MNSLQTITEEWVNQFGPAVEAMAGSPIQLSVSASGPQDAEEALIWHQQFDLGPDFAVYLQIPKATWLKIGQVILQGAGIDDATEDDSRGTFFECLQQSLSSLASWIGKKAGREVNPATGTAVEQKPELSEWFEISVSMGGEALPSLLFTATPHLRAVFEVQVKAAAASAERGAVARSGPSMEGSKTLDLLLEVELPVGVSFGRSQMRLKDAVKLTTGSIVELNRSIAEPVEIVVNNCVIARGEVVVVEGNYGVRILQIISREERLRTLF